MCLTVPTAHIQYGICFFVELQHITIVPYCMFIYCMPERLISTVSVQNEACLTGQVQVIFTRDRRKKYLKQVWNFTDLWDSDINNEPYNKHILWMHTRSPNHAVTVYMYNNIVCIYCIRLVLYFTFNTKKYIMSHKFISLLQKCFPSWQVSVLEINFLSQISCK